MAAGSIPRNRLDTIVHAAHRFRVAGRAVHPYLLMADLAIVAELTLALAWSRYARGFAFWRFVLAFVAMQATYHGVYLPLKLRLTGERARSFLQDTVLVILPSFVAVSWLLGLPLAAVFDLAGLALPLGLGLMRIGCFLGGCCYGRPSPRGVFYDREVLRAVDGWRRFTPGPYPGERVVPVQLLAAAANLTAFALLAVRAVIVGHPDGRALPLFLVAYSAFRFVSDRLRGHRHRPMRGPLSEAQWTSLTVIVLAGTALMVSYR
jgi:phosphatidylglycerol:prolipoprotein diacylglycerol transferase